LNDIESRKALQAELKKKFRGRKYVKSKVHARYKENLEREYQRIINAYFALLALTIKTHIKNIFAAPTFNQDGKTTFRTDDRKTDFLNYIKSAFRAAEKDLKKKEQDFGLAKKIKKIAEIDEKLSISEWKRVVKKTLGLDIRSDYYSGEFYRSQMQRWSEENADLISTLPNDALSEMQNIVEDGFLNGRSRRDITKDMQNRFGVSRNKARFWATDQLSKLTADITQQQQTDCGVEEYEWSTSGDQRVRQRHRELDGKRFRWDNPPIVDEKTGRRAHPGQDYRCRCVAIPIFNLETIDLPVTVTTNKTRR